MTDYGFEREPKNDDRLTASDLRFWRSESPTPLAPRVVERVRDLMLATDLLDGTVAAQPG